jgi:protein TonB
MSNLPAPPRDPHRGPDWLYAAPSFEIRWLAGAAVVLVPALLAMSVCWLRQLPTAGETPYASDTMVEVRILAAQQPLEPPRETILHTSRATPSNATEPVSIASETPTSDPVSNAAVSETAAASAPAFSAADPFRAPARQRMSAFQRALETHIALYRRYPEVARQARMQGTVQVLFSMRRDGSILDVWIRASSGQRVLDDAAMETIRLAQPLPRIPPEFPDRLTILMPVAFGML